MEEMKNIGGTFIFMAVQILLIIYIQNWSASLSHYVEQWICNPGVFGWILGQSVIFPWQLILIIESNDHLSADSIKALRDLSEAKV